jgi:hypothetical protein
MSRFVGGWGGSRRMRWQDRAQLRGCQRRVAFPRHRGRMGRGHALRQTVRAPAGDRHRVPRDHRGLREQLAPGAAPAIRDQPGGPGSRSPPATARPATSVPARSSWSRTPPARATSPNAAEALGLPLSLHTATRRQGKIRGAGEKTLRDASSRATKAFYPATRPG